MTPAQIKKISQDLFEKQGLALGKSCFIHRFFDNSDLMNRGNRGHASLPRSPSDYLVTMKGMTFYAEVKGTEKYQLPLSRIEPAQWGAMQKVSYAHGRYFVFVYQIIEKKWEVIPHWNLLSLLSGNLKSFKIEGTYNDWTEAIS